MRVSGHVLFFVCSGNVFVCSGNVFVCSGNVFVCSRNVFVCSGNVFVCSGKVVSPIYSSQQHTPRMHTNHTTVPNMLSMHNMYSH